MFGGYGKFGAASKVSRTFTGLPTHSIVRITGRFSTIDSWDGESFIVKVDGKQGFASA